MRNLHPAPEDKAAIYRELVESNSLLADRCVFRQQACRQRHGQTTSANLEGSRTQQPNSRILHCLTWACVCRGARGPEADAQAWPGSAPGVSPGAAAALADGVRPWHHSMATQQVAPQDEEAARRRFAAEVAAGGCA